MIAHRGACQRAPENTLAALRLAAELGADAIELDTKLTADGEVVVIHDQTLDRTTSGRGRVAAHTLDQIKALDAGSHFRQQFKCERVPTLREVFEREGQRQLINVEMGNYARPWNQLPDAVVSLVREYRLADRVLLSSFNPVALRKARRLAPEIPCALLTVRFEPKWMRSTLACLLRPDLIHADVRILSEERIAEWHDHGFRVNVWTVNDENRMRNLVAWGVEGLITDVPEAARRVIDDAQKRV
ncbi:MAG: glycerophosphodiester phosphodiesterase family protein [Anaerolineales bacterium]